MDEILRRQAQLFHCPFPYTELLKNRLLVYEEAIDLNKQTNPWKGTIDQVVWRYDTNHRRIPYSHDGTHLVCIQLQERNNVYDFVSSSSVLPDTEIVCGEQFMAICDVFVGSAQSMDANPNNRQLQPCMVDIAQPKAVESHLRLAQSVFVKTDDLHVFYQHYGHAVQNKTVVSHNSDHALDDSYGPYIGLARRHYGQNCLLRHEAILPLPIGIENRQWVDHTLFHRVRQRTDIRKEKLLYFFFSLATHPSRPLCYDILNKKEGCIWNQPLAKEDYFVELKKHRYAVCPRGNGLDTHRLWECLYLDVIPIMLRRDSVGIDHLPILFLEEWHDLDLLCLCLPSTFEHLECSRLTMKHYQVGIQNVPI